MDGDAIEASRGAEVVKGYERGSVVENDGVGDDDFDAGYASGNSGIESRHQNGKKKYIKKIYCRWLLS